MKDEKDIKLYLRIAEKNLEDEVNSLREFFNESATLSIQEMKRKVKCLLAIDTEIKLLKWILEEE
jgi:hypothetical protein